MTQDSISFLAYDTLCRLEISAGEGADLRGLLTDVRDIALSVQNCLSMYDDSTELATLCRTYTPGRPVGISPLLTQFLAQTLAVSRLSGGALDPTVGPLVQLWDFLAAQPRVPSDVQLREGLRRVGWQHLQLNEKNHTLTLGKPGMIIDPGASGKGFALGLAVAYLREHGVERGIVDFGGNMHVMGPRGQGERARPWQVAIRHPDDPARIMGQVEMLDTAIATSSWYEHCFTLEGKTYHHLLDPQTGMPMPLTLKSVSILSNEPVYTDLLSTALFIMGLEKGKVLVEELKRQSGKSIEFLAMTGEGEICMSQGVRFQPKA